MVCCFAHCKKADLEKVAALALLAICLAAPSLAKPFIDTFAFGISYGKVYAFALYVVLVVFSKGLFEKAGWKISGWHVTASIAALLVFGLAGHAFFVSSVNGEFGAKYFAFDTQGYTSEQANHIHVLKTVFCPLPINSENYDCGRSLLPYLPQYYDLFGIVLIITALTACAAFYPKMEMGHEKFAYLVLSFAALKTAVDGGALNYESIAFFALVPFLLAKEKRVLYSLIGIASWLVVGIFTYPFDNPILLALPFAAFFYPVCTFIWKPKLLFPFLAIALLAPSHLSTDNEIVAGRWDAEPCANSRVSAEYRQAVLAKLYTPCETQTELACGNVVAANMSAAYFGQSTEKPELLISKSLAGSCERGVFSIIEVRHSIKVVRKENP